MLRINDRLRKDCRRLIIFLTIKLLNYEFLSEPTNEITEYHNRFIKKINPYFSSFDRFIEVYTSKVYNKIVIGDERLNPLLKIDDDQFLKIFNYIGNFDTDITYEECCDILSCKDHNVDYILRWQIFFMTLVFPCLEDSSKCPSLYKMLCYQVYITRLYRNYWLSIDRFNKTRLVFVLESSDVPHEVKRYVIQRFIFNKNI